jgi:hypothetical protein
MAQALVSISPQAAGATLMVAGAGIIAMDVMPGTVGGQFGKVFGVSGGSSLAMGAGLMAVGAGLAVLPYKSL